MTKITSNDSPLYIEEIGGERGEKEVIGMKVDISEMIFFITRGIQRKTIKELKITGNAIFLLKW